MEYKNTGSDEDFAKLLEVLNPMLHNEAVKAERNNGIPRETMISHYSESVWQAVRGDAVNNFDGSSTFAQRFHQFFKCRLADEIKYKTAEKRTGIVESLDKEVPSSDGSPYGGSYAEAISSPVSVERDYLENEWTRKTLEGFRRSSERHSKIIQMLYDGYTNDEIAIAFGSQTYNDRIRQLVHRARTSFRAFLDKQKELEIT
jgi:DNA-directed RNA polymerase specialized sigma24 family protein